MPEPTDFSLAPLAQMFPADADLIVVAAQAIQRFGFAKGREDTVGYEVVRAVYPLIIERLRWSDEVIAKAVSEAHDYDHQEDIADAVANFKTILEHLPH